MQIKQGLHEIQTDNSVVVDYHDSVLINRDVIEKVNQRILSLGQYIILFIELVLIY